MCKQSKQSSFKFEEDRYYLKLVLPSRPTNFPASCSETDCTSWNECAASYLPAPIDITKQMHDTVWLGETIMQALKLVTHSACDAEMHIVKRAATGSTTVQRKHQGELKL